MNKPLIALSMMLLSLLAGCGQKPADDTTNPTAPLPTAPVASAPAETGVTRAETAPAPAAPSPALDTQPGPKGTQVALTKALVRGDILTVEVQYSVSSKADGAPTLYEKVDQVNYIDDATSKKYGVLKDQEGLYMASPLHSSKTEVRVETSTTSPSIATFKFPAPPANSQTISLSIPEVGSFNGVAVQR